MFEDTGVISNGKLFVFENGINIHSVCNAEKGGSILLCMYAEETLRDSAKYENKVCFHELKNDNNIVCARFADKIYGEYSVFERKAEVYSDTTFVLNFPKECNKRLISRFPLSKTKKEVVISEYCTENGFENILFILCDGNAEFDDSGDDLRIIFKKGNGRVLLSSGNANNCIKSLEKVLSKQYEEEVSEEKYDIKNENNEISKLLGKIIPQFLMHQKYDGGFVLSSSFEEANISQNCECLKTLCRLKLIDRADKCLEYISRKISEENFAYNSTSYASVFCDVLEAFSVYKQIFPSGKMFENNISLIRKMYYYVDKEAGKGVLPFSENDRFIKCGVLSSEQSIQGSFCDTVKYISLSEFYSDLFMPNKKSNSINIANSRLKANFSDGQKIYYNCVSQINRSPDFLYGYCKKCKNSYGFEALRWLSRNESGEYVCINCLENEMPSENEKYKAELPVSYFYGTVYPSSLKELCFEKTKYYENIFFENGYFSSCGEKSDMYFADLCLLIYALSVCDRKNLKKSQRILLNIVNQIGIYEKYDRIYGGTGRKNGASEYSRLINCLIELKP